MFRARICLLILAPERVLVYQRYDGVPSFNILKDHTNGFFRPKPKSIFDVHDSLGLRYLFQLRGGLSPLRNHKWCHNFADIPSNICHCNLGIEDASHFLFSCPAYANQGATLITSVNVIPQEYNLYVLRNQLLLYLYGHRSINCSG